MKKYALLIFASVLLMTMTFSPVFAKNFNLLEGQSIEYFSQGEGYIAVPAGALYANSPATTLEIVCNDGEDGTFGSADSIGIFQQFTTNGVTEYLPMAWFIASPDPTQTNAQVTFYRTLFKGLPAAVVAVIPLPTTPPTSITIANTKAVSDTVLSVERHGNTISAKLTASQTVIYATGVGTGKRATIPAFSVEFDKVGGNIHTDITKTLDSSKGLSGYTQIVEASGFEATGLFKCSSTAWTTTNAPMTNSLISMHEISIYIPPTSP
jgi:hypothetical protein